MEIARQIEVPEDPEAAQALQEELAAQVTIAPLPASIRWVAGCDVAYAKDDSMAYAGVVLLDRETQTVVEQTSWVGPPPYPYIPGLFAFREAIALLHAFAQLQTTPDVIFVDGHGRAHPRRFGAACHIGLALNIPTIGCGKTRLVGDFEDVPSPRGSFSKLHDQGEVVGRVLRTQDGVKPVFVSVGHRSDLDTACALTLEFSPSYRIPEPLRGGHNLSIALRKEGSQ